MTLSRDIDERKKIEPKKIVEYSFDFLGVRIQAYWSIIAKFGFLNVLVLVESGIKNRVVGCIISFTPISAQSF